MLFGTKYSSLINQSVQRVLLFNNYHIKHVFACKELPLYCSHYYILNQIGEDICRHARKKAQEYSCIPSIFDTVWRQIDHQDSARSIRGSNTYLNESISLPSSSTCCFSSSYLSIISLTFCCSTPGTAFCPGAVGVIAPGVLFEPGLLLVSLFEPS